MKRGMWTCLLLILVGAVVMGLALGLAGCGGGRPAATDAGESSVEAAPEETTVPEAVEPTTPEPEPTEEAPAVETDAAEAGEPAPDVAAPSTEPSEVEATEADRPAALLEWERQGGSAGHCDRMTIFPDGSVIAVLCLNGIDRGTVETTLSADQADQLNAWADRFASFSRRESDIAAAAMRTVMEGRGEAVPTTEEKTAVAKFAKDLFLALTTPPE
jgi:type IV secretory pathway VirB10-like protein